MALGFFSTNPAQSVPNLNAAPDPLSFDSNPARETLSFDQDMDRLAALQHTFKTKTIEFDLDLKYWEKIKLSILAQGKVDEDVEVDEQLSFLAKVKVMLGLFKSYFECPDHYIKKLYEQNKPEMESLTQHLDKLTDELQRASKSSPDIHRLKVAICNTNIAVINSFQAMINQINREIDYCVKWVNLLETVTTTLIQYVVGFKLPLPPLDFGFGSHYRMGLYNMIHKPLESIYHFLLDSQGAIERSRKLNLEVPTSLKSATPSSLLATDEAAHSLQENAKLMRTTSTDSFFKTAIKQSSAEWQQEILAPKAMHRTFSLPAMKG